MWKVEMTEQNVQLEFTSGGREHWNECTDDVEIRKKYLQNLSK